jgi:mono/diheme cytochrome c family protein
MNRRPAARRLIAALSAGVLALVLVAAWFEWHPAAPASTSTAAPLDAQQVQRGAYLALAGNCAGCHTARGGPPYAGGRGIETPFGTVIASNLTPDDETGLGRWSAEDFRRALHHGHSRDGRLLYPAFPYVNFTLITVADADAIHAYLRSLPPVRRAEAPHRLRFPFNLQLSLALWRALYFRPSTFEPEETRSTAWNRGSYLVRGLGHCSACHGQRNRLGATGGDADFNGGMVPGLKWYAPSLLSTDEAGMAGWPQHDVIALLQQGIAPRATVMGPMAEVVLRSTQHLSAADQDAMATFLRALPMDNAEPPPAVPAPVPWAAQDSARLYARHCADCHGDSGQGVPGRYAALAGNRAIVMASPTNIIQVILHGGFAPATAGHPRPFGMPPFAQLLSDEEVAMVATHLRQSWGHSAAPVSALDVLRAR